MSVVYEVNLEADPGIEGQFAAWLPGHVERVGSLPGFTGASIEREERAPGERPAWCVRYVLENRAALERYLNEHAAAMRQEGVDAFADRFTATRRILSSP